MCGSKADRWRELGKGKAQEWQLTIRIPQHFFRKNTEEWNETDTKFIRRLISEFIREMEQQGCMIKSYLVSA